MVSELASEREGAGSAHRTSDAREVVNAYEVAAATPDPELPLVTIGDLGILRSVDEQDGHVVATITPTYSGCPAMREITADLAGRLGAAGYADVQVRVQLAPPWTSEWITPAGRAKLEAAGIAPPAAVRPRTAAVPLTLGPPPPVTCPRCGSSDTALSAAFGATACKALHRCRACAEPFEAVKAI
jgi:ring-1,2-phenylacetyl-CoA epoxidase subunit PaaD